MKVRALGIIGRIYDWSEDWLKDREQRVVLLGSNSKWSKLMSGVPQRSVLGPLLFLIYINDLDDAVCSRVLKFADDTKLFSVVSNANDIDGLKTDLRHLCNWSQDWQMFFNVDKCKVMHIEHSNYKAKHEMIGKFLDEVTEDINNNNYCLT